MKNKIGQLLCGCFVFFALCCISSMECKAAGPVAINETTFPDATFRQMISNFADTDSDGILSVEELHYNNAFNISDSNITDLTGIENFSYIYFLNIMGGNVKKVNLSGVHVDNLFCSNTSVEEFDLTNSTITIMNITYNSKLSKLTGLSTVKGLYEMKCMYCNIDSFSFPKGSSLVKIYVSGNKLLKKLDATMCSGLKTLECDNCNLTSLNVKGMKTLNRLDYHNNKDLGMVNLYGVPARGKNLINYNTIIAFRTIHVSGKTTVKAKRTIELKCTPISRGYYDRFLKCETALVDYEENGNFFSENYRTSILVNGVSSNPLVATVDKNYFDPVTMTHTFQIKTYQKGTAKITFTALDGIKKSITLKVK